LKETNTRLFSREKYIGWEIPKTIGGIFWGNFFLLFSIKNTMKYITLTSAILFFLFFSACKENFDIQAFKEKVEGQQIGCLDLVISKISIDQETVDESIDRYGKIVGYITISDQKQKLVCSFSIKHDLSESKDAFKHIVLEEETQQSIAERFIYANRQLYLDEAEGVNFSLTNKNKNSAKSDEDINEKIFWITYEDQDNQIKHMGSYYFKDNDVLQVNHEFKAKQISKWSCNEFSRFFLSEYEYGDPYPQFEVKNFKMTWENKSYENCELNGTLYNTEDKAIFKGSIMRDDQSMDDQEVHFSIIK
jgi:hypothetical protein